MSWVPVLFTSSWGTRIQGCSSHGKLRFGKPFLHHPSWKGCGCCGCYHLQGLTSIRHLYWHKDNGRSSLFQALEITWGTLALFQEQTGMLLNNFNSISFTMKSLYHWSTNKNPKLDTSDIKHTSWNTRNKNKTATCPTWCWQVRQASEEKTDQ